MTPNTTKHCQTPFSSKRFPTALSSQAIALPKKWEPAPLSVNYMQKEASQSVFTCNYVLQLNKTKYEMAQYLYGCLFAPAIPTLKETIRRGNLITFPGINTINF